MSIAKYNFDVFTNTLTVSRIFEKYASIPGSAEQKMMSKYFAIYGEALVIKRYAKHKARDGVSFTQMENYIKNTRDAAIMLKQFETVKELSVGRKNPYKYVREWFNDNYPNYSEQPEFDKDGYVIVKANHKNAVPQEDETSEKPTSKLAEG